MNRALPVEPLADPVPTASSFAAVFARLKPHMAALDAFLREQVAAFEPEIREMADYCIDTSGKRIRPALVFLSGWQGEGEVPAELVRAAAVVELVHLATLVHDDIMDEAELRRSRETAARKFGPVTAVLLGDALFAQALSLAAQFPTTEVCAHVSESTRRVCAGEIVQTMRRRSARISREDYWRIIDLKTAELFRVSCFLGARLSGAPAAHVQASAEFGRHLGIAYQIYDDLVDFFGDESRIGKTLGTDFASGKLTLPLLVLIESLAADERAALLAEINGQRPVQMARRLEQMQELRVFEKVAAEVQAEIEAAERALAPWPQAAATPLLGGLCGVLRAQVAGLRHS
ncbi:polyprenyl synthetase [Cephaloticoccus primus]|uniref:Polyprenyl synthetase n=1 Tax=Cephaloticoccus primus TaxID=1548207 RepID=A0A139SSQ7_9BACT|nr:polyprenyl synthetase family protein [Cephaloticoccus primus]KXU37596.1 polyprenyl synthetase [Cephaloticoccus primus]